MAADPIFAATIRAAHGTTPAVDTSLTAPSTATSVFTAGANGSKIEQIRCTQLLTTAAQVYVNLFLYDGSVFDFFDYFTFPTLTLSSTVHGVPQDKYYPNLVLPTGWSLRITQMTGTTASFKVSALGGDF